jgi:WD40 repeat protein
VGNGWEGWLALLYLPSPDQSAQFGSYFSKRWFATLVASVHNLLSAVFRALPLPSLLAFNVERERRRRTNGELRNLRAELERTRLERDQAQVQLARLRSQGYRIFQQPQQQQRRGVSHPQPTLANTSTTNNASNAPPLPLVAVPRAASSSSKVSDSGSAAPTAIASGLAVPFARGGGESMLPAVSSSSSSSSSIGEQDETACFAATSEPHVLLGHPGPVSKVRFNNEGSALLSMANNAAFFNGHEDGTTTLLSPPSSASSPREEDEDADHSSSSGGAVTQLWDMSALLDANRRGGVSPRKSPQRRQQSLSLFQRAEDDRSTAVTMTMTPSAPSSRRATYSATMPSANNSINNPFASPLRAQQQQQQQQSRAVSISPGRSASASVASQSGFVGSSSSAGDEESAGGGDVAEREDEDGDDASKSLLLRLYGSIAHATPLASVAWSKSDSYILTGSATDGKVGVWQLLSANKTGVQQQQQASKAAKLLAEFVSPDALGSPSGGGSAGGSGMSCPVVLDLATSPGDRFFVASWAQASSREWTSLGSPSSSGSLGAKVNSSIGSALSSSSSAQGFLELWDLASGKRSTVFALPGSSSSLTGGTATASPISSECTQINSLSLNHNGNMLVTGGADGVVRVWDTRASAAMAGWLAHPHALTSSSGSKGGGGGVACVRLCADETTLLSVGCDGAVVEWSLHRMGNVLRRVAQPPRPLPPIPTTAAATAVQNPDPVGEYYARAELALDGEARHGLLSGGVGWAAWTTATTTMPDSSRRSSVVASYDHEQNATAAAAAGHATSSSSYAALLFPLPPISAGNASGAPPSPSSSSSGDPATASMAAAMPAYSSSPLQRLHLHAGPVLSVDWHPTAAIFATGAADHTARIVCGRTR